MPELIPEASNWKICPESGWTSWIEINMRPGADAVATTAPFGPTFEYGMKNICV